MSAAAMVRYVAVSLSCGEGASEGNWMSTMCKYVLRGLPEAEGRWEESKVTPRCGKGGQGDNQKREKKRKKRRGERFPDREGQ